MLVDSSTDSFLESKHVVQSHWTNSQGAYQQGGKKLSIDTFRFYNWNECIDTFDKIYIYIHTHVYSRLEII